MAAPLVHPACPIRTAFELVGGKWKLLVLHQLHPVALRYSALRQRLPDISEKVLVSTLRILEQDDLVARVEAGRVVEYALTERGRLALPLIDQLAAFSQAYRSVGG